MNEKTVVFYTKTFNRDKFFSKHPTLVRKVGSVCFYEHPVYGDEFPLVADDGVKVVLTDDYDVPSLEKGTSDFELKVFE